MKATYIYYAAEEKSASVKNMFKTCDYLGREINLSVCSSVNTDGLYEFYSSKKSFSYLRLGLGVENKLLEFFDRLIFSLLAFFELKLRNKDLVYTRDIFFLTLLRLMPSSSEHVIYECHNPYGETSIFPEVLERLALQAPDKIFCVSEGVEESITEKGVPDEKLTVQRNCADMEVYQDMEPQKQGNVFRIVYAGRFKHKKGVKVLLDAFEVLKEKNENYKLIILGKKDNRFSDVIESYSGAINPGFVSEEDLARFFKDADVLVLPSRDTSYQRRYTCPMKLLEYMASGTPVVASRLPTTEWVARDTVCYFEPGNSDSLARKIRLINEDVESCKLEPKKALERVKNNFTWGEKSNNIIREFNEMQVD